MEVWLTPESYQTRQQKDKAESVNACSSMTAHYIHILQNGMLYFIWILKFTWKTRSLQLPEHNCVTRSRNWLLRSRTMLRNT
jgi:hypothetical protein